MSGGESGGQRPVRPARGAGWALFGLVVATREGLGRAEIRELAGRVGEREELGVTREQGQTVARRRDRGEAVPQRARRARLESRSIDHAGREWSCAVISAASVAVSLAAVNGR